MIRELNLIEYFPEQLHNDVTREILRTEEYFLNKEMVDLERLINEFNVMTAVESLPYHCDIAGIDYNEDIPIDVMRSNILVSYQAIGITTAEVVKNLVENYSNAKCLVDDKKIDDICIIKFIDKVGKPSNIEEIKKALYNVSPAHVDFKFEYKYRTWGDLKKIGITYGQAKEHKFSCKQLREGSISPYDDRYME